MLVVPVLMIVGVLYTGHKTHRQWRVAKKAQSEPFVPETTPEAEHPCLQQAKQQMILSAGSLGLASAGNVLHWAILGWMSLPITLYIFMPVYKQAFVTVRQHQRLNEQVLTAARLTVCSVMGYTVIAALDANLYSLSHWLVIQDQQTVHRRLRHRFKKKAQPLLALLEQAAQQPTTSQQYGEKSGLIVAPWMLAIFGGSTPLLGVNRGAAFLTTFFGAHMRHLGPYTTRRLVYESLQQQVLVTHPQTFERMTRVDTLVLDCRMAESSIQTDNLGSTLNALRQWAQEQQRPLQIHVWGQAVAEHQPLLPLVETWCEPASGLDHEWITQQQQAGHTVCYLSLTEAEPVKFKGADLTVQFMPQAIPVIIQPCAGEIWLLQTDMQALPAVFRLADRFVNRQWLNLVVPIGVDVIDISTTLLLDFGLVYSVGFTYSGLLLGMIMTQRT